MNIAKKIVLFFFGKRIRKTIMKDRGAVAKLEYKRLVESPLSEWSDRLWIIRNLDFTYLHRFDFLHNGITLDSDGRTVANESSSN